MSRKERRAAQKTGGIRPGSGRSEAAQLLDTAYRHHQSGQLAEAERLYRSILASDPNNATALQLLGVLANQVGQPEAAVGLIRDAIALNRRVPEMHFNIGGPLQALGRHAEAISHYSEAIALKPDFVEAHY